MGKFNWIRPGYEIVNVKLDWNEQVPFLLTRDGQGKTLGSPEFCPQETPNSKWRLGVDDGTTEIYIALWHYNSAGKGVKIVDPVMVKMSILKGKRQKVFQQMLPFTSDRYVLFKLSKEEIVKSECHQADGSLNICCKIYAHEKKVLLSPADPSVAVDCSGVGLVDHLEQLFDKMNLSDVTFIIGGGRKFPAHKSILAARSEYFAGMFNHPTTENLSGQIKIEDIEPEVFHQLLRFIYTDRLSPSAMETMAANLFIAADKYLIQGLKSQCENHLVLNMSPHNCIFLLLYCDLLNPVEYLKEVSKFFRHFLNEVMDTDDWKRIKKDNPTHLCNIHEFVYRCK